MKYRFAQRALGSNPSIFGKRGYAVACFPKLYSFLSFRFSRCLHHMYRPEGSNSYTISASGLSKSPLPAYGDAAVQGPAYPDGALPSIAGPSPPSAAPIQFSESADTRASCLFSKAVFLPSFQVLVLSSPYCTDLKVRTHIRYRPAV